MRVYYVSAINGKRVSLMVGPLTQHEEALGLVEEARKIASELDSWSDFWHWGTLSIDETGAPEGTMNRYFSSIV